MSSPIKVIYILGAGHSGSTVLGLMLGSQPRFESYGEVGRRIERYSQLEGRKCTCEALFEQCPVWGPIFEGYPRSVSPQQVVAFTQHAYRLLANAAGGGWIVDGSKSVHYLKNPLSLPEATVFIVHLVRDGRAVAFSNYLKKRDLLQQADSWINANARILRYLERCDARRQMRVRYEDFVRDPVRIITSILTCVGEHKNSIELNWGSKTHHHIGGNRMRFNSNTHIKADIRYIEEIRDAEWSALTSAMAPALHQFDYSESKAGMLSLLRSRQ